jgi:hypothetical protein
MLEEPTTTAPPPTGGFNLLDALVGVITRPVPTMATIATARPWLIALAVYMVIALIGGVASMVGVNIDAQLAQMPPEMRDQFEPLFRALFNPGTAIISALVSAPIWLTIISAIYFGVGRLLHGQGAFSSVFSTQAFATVPSVGASVLTALLNLAGPMLAPLTGLVGLGFGIWTLVLSVIGIRESMGFSTGRAVATVLIPLAVIIVVCCCLAFVFGAAIAGIVAGTSSG